MLMLLVSCGSIKEPVVTYKGTKASSISGKSMELVLEVDVDNPNRRKIKIKPSWIKVTVNGTPVARATNTERISIDKHNITSLTIPVHANLEDGALGTLLSNVFKPAVTVRLEGKIRVKYGLIGRRIVIQKEIVTTGEKLNVN
jgi:LEA14-like dessication related protein